MENKTVTQEHLQKLVDNLGDDRKYEDKRKGYLNKPRGVKYVSYVILLVLLGFLVYAMFNTSVAALDRIQEAKAVLSPQVEAAKVFLDQKEVEYNQAKAEHKKLSEGLGSLEAAERTLLAQVGIDVIAQGNFTPTAKGLKNFLAVNAAKAFQNPEPWREAGRKHGIHSSLLVCIGQADSSLGNNLKSRFNVGNVANNDRGQTKGYNSPEEGIEAIALTLNNAYLNSKQTLGSLSTGGGGQNPVYATSNYTWNKNVKGCVSTIEGVQVDANWQFRI